MQAVRKVVAQQKQPEEITETTIASSLYTFELPDPELVIRAGGEKRISNYLLWQSAYAQFYFTESFWPILSRQDVEDAISHYNQNLDR